MTLYEMVIHSKHDKNKFRNIRI